MEIFVVACHYTKTGSLIGLRLLDIEADKVTDVTISNLKDAIRNKGLKIHDITYKNNKLTLVNKSEYSKYIDNQLMGTAKSIVVSDSGDVGKRIIASCKGVIQAVSDERVIKAIKSGIISNAKLVNDEIVPINDAFVPLKRVIGFSDAVSVKSRKDIDAEVERVKEITKNRVDNESALDKKKKILNKDNTISNNRLKFEVRVKPTVIQGKACDLSMLKEPGKDGLNAEQKMTNLMTRLRNARPFLYSVMYSMNRVISEDVERAGATVDTLYINPIYLKDTPMEELLFILAHELYHVAMRHAAREGKKDHRLWNIACDLYNNKMLTEDFGIPVYENKAVEVKYNDKYLGFYVLRYHDIYYSPSVDVRTDTPEKIYTELMDDLNKKKNNQNKDQNENQNNSGSESGSESGDSSSGNNNNDEQDEKEQNSDGSRETKDSTGNSSSENSDGQGGNNSSQGGNNSIRYKDIEINLDDFKDDLIDDQKTANMSEEQKQNRSKSIVNRAVTIQKQIAGFGGPSASVLERLVEIDIAPKINWRTVVKRYLTASSETYTSYSSPDRRFLSRNMVLPGPKSDNESALENVKIFIDTSGSISDKDLGIALNQIKQLLNTFKAKAEVLYWDTEIRSTCEFDSIETLLKSKPRGGGGTDANCIFEHFETREYKIGKKQMPSVIIIFTDGYFGDINIKYKKHKNVVWIVHDNPGFKCEIGTVAPFKLNE